MPTLQAEYITRLEAFARLFSKRIWEHAKILLIDAGLRRAERTVAAVLQVMGLSGKKKRMIEITSNTAVWYHTGHPSLPIR